MGAPHIHLPFRYQVLVACPSPPDPRVLLLDSPDHWLEVCRDPGKAYPTERAAPNSCSQYLLKEDTWKQQDIN